MHNNYFFLSKLSSALNERLHGFSFGEIFSQNKDELILGLLKDDQQFYIKAYLSPQFSCLSFPGDFHRAKKNSIDLFGELIDQKILEIEVANFDRSIKIHCEQNTLVLKLYGNRTNILLFEGSECIDIFKQKFDQDQDISIEELDKDPDLSYESFERNNFSIQKFAPTLGKDAKDFFKRSVEDISDQKIIWGKLIDLIDQLPKNQVFIIDNEGLPQLLLFPVGKIKASFIDPVEALNYFFNLYIKVFSIENKKQALISEKKKQLKKAESYIKKSDSKLSELVESRSYNQIADIIMANLHQIPAGADEIELFDFYQNQNVKLKLNKSLSPQKNAENLYRKSKNQKIEIEKLKENIERKKKEKEQLDQEIREVMKADEFKELKKMEPRTAVESKDNATYHRLQVGEFEILVGKNAKRNDELTFKVANKDDLWFHVKDAAGSHVIVRQIPGKNPGENVIEKAASLAAYFSKRKTESLVPVSFTERKFVRKTKHLLPGQVIVEKEKVMLAEPVNWLKEN